MIFGIMGAMPDEVDQLCAKLTDVTVDSYGGVEYHQGTLAGKQVVVCCAGMGKANAAATTQVLILRYGAQRIIFSGIAGNMSSQIGIGDVVIGKTVVYHDAQLDMIAQNPPFLTEYTGDPALVAAAEAACQAAGVKALTGQDRHRRPVCGRQRHQGRHPGQMCAGLRRDGGRCRQPDRRQKRRALRDPAGHERQCRRGRPRGAGGEEIQHQ